MVNTTGANADGNPFPSHWRTAIEAGYQYALKAQDNIAGARTVLAEAGYTSDDISRLTLQATMTQTDLEASTVKKLAQTILGHTDASDCSCDGCKPVAISSIDDCTTFTPLNQ